MIKISTATLNPDETVKILKAIGMATSATTIRDGLQQRRFPFGDYIETERSCRCFVYPVPLKKWIMEKFGIDVDIDAYRSKTLEVDDGPV